MPSTPGASIAVRCCDPAHRERWPADSGCPSDGVGEQQDSSEGGFMQDGEGYAYSGELQIGKTVYGPGGSRPVASHKWSASLCRQAPAQHLVDMSLFE